MIMTLQVFSLQPRYHFLPLLPCLVSLHSFTPFPSPLSLPATLPLYPRGTRGVSVGAHSRWLPQSLERWHRSRPEFCLSLHCYKVQAGLERWTMNWQIRLFQRTWQFCSLIPRPRPAFCRLQYWKLGGAGNEATLFYHCSCCNTGTTALHHGCMPMMCLN